MFKKQLTPEQSGVIVMKRALTTQPKSRLPKKLDTRSRITNRSEAEPRVAKILTVIAEFSTF